MTHEREREALARVLAGEKIWAVAKSFGVPYASVWRAVNYHRAGTPLAAQIERALRPIEMSPNLRARILEVVRWRT